MKLHPWCIRQINYNKAEGQFYKVFLQSIQIQQRSVSHLIA
jgi:hypothetical protein